MCGIAGIVGPAGGRLDVALAAGRAMAATIAHRGPDASGEHGSERGPVVLTHRRLSIIDLSAEGAQPMRSRSGRWVIAYNGEIYNHRVLRAELENGGSLFRGHSDTEVLVEAIDAWGVDRTLERCNGMFAFAVLDLANDCLTVARDRLGEKPLYWMHDGEQFAFASELQGPSYVARCRSRHRSGRRHRASEVVVHSPPQHDLLRGSPAAARGPARGAARTRRGHG